MLKLKRLNRFLASLIKTADLSKVKVDASVLASFGDSHSADSFRPEILDEYVEQSNREKKSSQTIVSDPTRDAENPDKKDSAFLAAPKLGINIFFVKKYPNTRGLLGKKIIPNKSLSP